MINYYAPFIAVADSLPRASSGAVTHNFIHNLCGCIALVSLACSTA